VAFAGGHLDVAGVEVDGLGDAGCGVEGGEGDRLVPQTGAVGFAEQAELVAFVQCSGGGLGDVGAFGGGGAEPG
jgi:hypothetical protein